MVCSSVLCCLFSISPPLFLYYTLSTLLITCLFSEPLCILGLSIFHVCVWLWWGWSGHWFDFSNHTRLIFVRTSSLVPGTRHHDPLTAGHPPSRGHQRSCNTHFCTYDPPTHLDYFFHLLLTKTSLACNKLSQMPLVVFFRPFINCSTK